MILCLSANPARNRDPATTFRRRPTNLHLYSYAPNLHHQKRVMQYSGRAGVSGKQRCSEMLELKFFLDSFMTVNTSGQSERGAGRLQGCAKYGRLESQGMLPQKITNRVRSFYAGRWQRDEKWRKGE